MQLHFEKKNKYLALQKYVNHYKNLAYQIRITIKVSVTPTSSHIDHIKIYSHSV